MSASLHAFSFRGLDTGKLFTYFRGHKNQEDLTVIVIVCKHARVPNKFVVSAASIGQQRL
jgi:hypothetical protein